MGTIILTPFRGAPSLKTSSNALIMIIMMISLDIYGYAYIFMDIHTSRYMYDAPCDIHDAFPMRHTYASYSDAFMTRSVSDAWETRLIPSVELALECPQ